MFADKNKGMATFLASAMKWSNFDKSLVCGIEEHGSLTTRQEQALTKMMNK